MKSTKTSLHEWKSCKSALKKSYLIDESTVAQKQRSPVFPYKRCPDDLLCCFLSFHSNVRNRKGRGHNYVFIPPSGNVQWIHWKRGWINDTFIHYHFNIATVHNQLQYNEAEPRKQISRKPKEYFLPSTLHPRGIWLPICNKSSFADI